MLNLTGSNHSSRRIHPGTKWVCWSLTAISLTLIAQAAGLCDALKSDGKPATSAFPLYPPAIKGESLKSLKSYRYADVDLPSALFWIKRPCTRARRS